MKVFKLFIVMTLFFSFEKAHSQMIKSELNTEKTDFKEIRIEDIAQVFFTKGSENSIIVERSSDKDKEIQFSITDGIASVKAVHSTEESKKNNYNLYITSKSDDIFINAYNLGIVQTTDKAQFGTIKLKVINAGKIDLTVDTQTLVLNIENVASLKISGKTDQLTLDKKNVMLSNLRKLKVKKD